MRAGGVDCGAVEQAERATPRGLLRWRISLRSDGHRPLAGAAPALITWGDAHPTDALGDSGVALAAMSVAGWPQALAPLLPASIARTAATAARAAPPISVRLSSPRGVVTLQSTRLEG